jgi:hypothetical protein
MYLLCSSSAGLRNSYQDKRYDYRLSALVVKGAACSGQQSILCVFCLLGVVKQTERYKGEDGIKIFWPEQAW